ncbi:MAG: tRNA lysidine(34) synthetase TilS [Marinibacterium sp.]|nr:tRNA lysidine(34) synthetase TilS [Marinibacterium sp.]
MQPGPPARLGVAVSGGGDSVALLHLLHETFADEDVELFAATVDHGLRPEAAKEASRVADMCETLGLPHSTLRWRGWDGCGNLQDQARRARYRLLTDWAKSYQLSHIALGHTADDQAETVLMRLGRSSGVDGLSAMSHRRILNGINLVRPLLNVGRSELRGYLEEKDVGWVEDPSNNDETFDRIKARRALEALEPLGITSRSLNDVARNMAQAREALDWYSFLTARDIVVIDGGDVLIEHRRLRTLPEEIIRRLLIRAVCWINSEEYAPRSASVSNLVACARDRRPATLAGCQMLHHGPHVWICREFNAVRSLHCATDTVWDNRWSLDGPNLPDCRVEPLGRRGILMCEGWRSTGRPYASILSSPSVWQHGELLSAPLAGSSRGWKANLIGGAEDYFSGLLTH